MKKNKFKYCIVQLFYAQASHGNLIDCNKCMFSKDCETKLDLTDSQKEIYDIGVRHGMLKAISIIEQLIKEQNHKKCDNQNCMEKMECCELTLSNLVLNKLEQLKGTEGLSETK